MIPYLIVTWVVFAACVLLFGFVSYTGLIGVELLYAIIPLDDEKLKQSANVMSIQLFAMWILMAIFIQVCTILFSSASMEYTEMLLIAHQHVSIFQLIQNDPH